MRREQPSLYVSSCSGLGGEAVAAASSFALDR
jgi:hypothetical protein